MSRQKKQISELNLSKIGGRIAYARLKIGDSIAKLAKKTGLSAGNVSGLENHKYEPSYQAIVKILEVYKLNSDWLLTGRGSPYIIGDKKEGGEIGASADPDPEVNELLNMTRAVIKSDTGYALSLKANIRSFYDAVETKRQIQNLEQRVSRMEKDRGDKRARCIEPPAAPKINGENIAKKAI